MAVSDIMSWYFAIENGKRLLIVLACAHIESSGRLQYGFWSKIRVSYRYGLNNVIIVKKMRKIISVKFKTTSK